MSVGVDCAGLNAVSDAKDAKVDASGDWAAKVNGLDAEAPAPKPTKPPNLGGGRASWVGHEERRVRNTRRTYEFVWVRSEGWWDSVERRWLRGSQGALGESAYSETGSAAWCTQQRVGARSLGQGRLVCLLKALRVYFLGCMSRGRVRR